MINQNEIMNLKQEDVQRGLHFSILFEINGIPVKATEKKLIAKGYIENIKPEYEVHIKKLIQATRKQQAYDSLVWMQKKELELINPKYQHL